MAKKITASLSELGGEFKLTTSKQAREVLSRLAGQREAARRAAVADIEVRRTDEGDPELIRKIERLDAEIERYLDRCAAHPVVRRHLCGPWTVDVSGSEQSAKMPSDPEQAPQTREEVRELVRSASPLVRRVEAAVGRLGFEVTDSGVGADGWDIGVTYVTEPEADRLCDALHEEFADEIATGRLVVYKRFWGYRMRDQVDVIEERLH